MNENLRQIQMSEWSQNAFIVFKKQKLRIGSIISIYERENKLLPIIFSNV